MTQKSGTFHALGGLACHCREDDKKYHTPRSPVRERVELRAQAGKREVERQQHGHDEVLDAVADAGVNLIDARHRDAKGEAAKHRVHAEDLRRPRAQKAQHDVEHEEPRWDGVLSMETGRNGTQDGGTSSASTSRNRAVLSTVYSATAGGQIDVKATQAIARSCCPPPCSYRCHQLRV